MVNDECELALLLNSEPDLQDPIAIGCDPELTGQAATEADSSMEECNILIFLPVTGL